MWCICNNRIQYKIYIFDYDHDFEYHDMIYRYIVMKFMYLSETKTRIVRKKRERRLPIRETIRKDACNNVR